jgi:WD40 repeat protein
VAPPASPVFVKISQGITFTADAKAGLRAWSTKSNPSLIATSTFGSVNESTSPVMDPSTINVDDQLLNGTKICIGSHDGSFQIHQLKDGGMSLRYRQPPTGHGSISAIAMHYPYIVTISDQMMALYRFDSSQDGSERLASLRLVATSKSNRILTPVSLSIRGSSRGPLLSVVYGLPSWNLNWAVAMQEYRLAARDGEEVVSPSKSNSHEAIYLRCITECRSAVQQYVLHPEMRASPTALSYSHPYLLAALPDNTLMMYMVTSTASRLDISPGQRLWGHTSHISGLQVSERGRAVSVSLQGNDIRVWELEDVQSPSFGRRGSVQVQPKNKDDGVITEAINRRGEVVNLAQYGLHLQAATARSWVGFDEEQVVVLGKQSHRQILSCYDFT